MESGAPTARFCQPPTNALPTKQFEGFLEAVNISPSMSSDDIMAALRSPSLTAQEIKDASASVYSFYNPSIRWAFQPVIDGDGGFIPKAPLSMWNSGSWNKVPILTGFCTNEGAPFVPYSMDTSEEFTSFFHVLNPELTPVDIGTINSLYPDPLIDKASPYLQTQAGPGAEYNRITAAYGQFGYISPIRQSAFYASTSSNTPVYLYQFAANSSVTQGTGHDCVGGYTTYESYITSVSATQQTLAASVVGYWTSFIATGDPNGENRNTAISVSKKAVWPQYHSVSLTPNKLLFGKGNDERAGGKSVGVMTQSEIDTEFINETTFWALHTGSTEN
jgi:acetylcholinesterase